MDKIKVNFAIFFIKIKKKGECYEKIKQMIAGFLAFALFLTSVNVMNGENVWGEMTDETEPIRYLDSEGGWQDAVMPSEYENIMALNVYKQIDIESITIKAQIKISIK